MFKRLILQLLAVIVYCSCNAQDKKNANNTEVMIMENTNNTVDTAIFASGCFWGTEYYFKKLKGVVSTEVGYIGGTIKNPAYREVCTGRTGAAEVIEITYDKTKTNLDEIFKVFFTVHDPTTLNRQGADVGTQYRSVIFYKNENEKKAAQDLINDLNKEVFDNKIVTTLEPLKKFYKAEEYHQGYYENNKNKPYCQMVIQPKIEKFEKVFKDRLKK